MIHRERAKGQQISPLIAIYASSLLVLCFCGSGDASESSPPQDRYESLQNFDKDSKYVQLSYLVGQLTLVIPTANGLQPRPVCTALAINKWYVLTARHCLYDEAGNQREYTDALVSLNGDGTGKKTFTLFHDAADEGCSGSPSDCNEDFAILKSKEPMDLPSLGLLKLGGPPQPKAPLFILHYPGGGPIVLTEFECHAFNVPIEGIELHHTCDTREGSSGAPIFDSDNDLIGVHLRSGKSDDALSYNRGILLSELISRSKIVRDSLQELAHATLQAVVEEPVSVVYTLSDGRSVVKRGDQWLLRKNRNGTIQSSILVPQIAGGADLIFWDRDSDDMLRFSQKGGPVQARTPDDPNWRQISTSALVK